ncbi:MAG: tRNA (adenosine(37)-N6)-threonylcarbamoyltransferase complex dimerization subunit type 1 TsaB [Planctomycetota bacterium]|nr:MAG: tRNA (adenosine(37)-N6)-threonylcarbamoyltransferase complex dimerization subunit type 1 TsaB [Planctomycetota bacterium]
MTPQDEAPILAIETSTRQGTIALRHEGRLRQRALPPSARRHAQTLAVAVRDLLTDCRLHPRQIPLVAVGIGPGSFTGLRIGVMFAKTWAYAVAGRVIGVPTFWSVAAHCAEETDRLTVIADAQRGELYTQTYRRPSRPTAGGEAIRCDICGAPPGWQAEAPLRIVPLDEWLANRAAGEAIGGPALPRVLHHLPGYCRPLDPQAAHPDAAGIAGIAGWLADRGQFADLWTLEPLYVRRSAAEEKAAAADSHSSRSTAGESSDER